MSTEHNRETKEVQTRGMTQERRKRINRLKKMIMYTVLLMILLPVAGCIILGVRLYRTGRNLEELEIQIGFLERALQDSMDAADRANALLEINEGIWKEAGQKMQGAEMLSEDDVTASEEMLSENDTAPEEEIREVYLTFDDGPSIYTEEILDILAEYDVKATFFVVGKDKEEYGDIYRRIVEEGHTLGMHSYSHEYSNIYASLENFQADMEQLRDYLYRETGVASSFYRFPGGSSNEVSQTDMSEMTSYLNAMGIRYFDWNVSAGDATSATLGSAQIVDQVMRQLPSRRVAVVLLHDARDKHSTVEALPELIEKIRAMDDRTVLLPITEETMLIQHTPSQ